MRVGVRGSEFRDCFSYIRSWTLGLGAQCSARKHEDLSSNPKKPFFLNEPCHTHPKPPSMWGVETGGSLGLEDHQVSSWFRETLSQGSKVDSDPGVSWPPCPYTDAFISADTSIHMHTQYKNYSSIQRHWMSLVLGCHSGQGACCLLVRTPWLAQPAVLHTSTPPAHGGHHPPMGITTHSGLDPLKLIIKKLLSRFSKKPI